MSRAGASLGTSPPWSGVARSGAGREAGTARVHGQALHARCPCSSSLSRARRFLFSPSGREDREGRRQVASACVRGKARLSLEGFRCCLALLPVVYVSHVVTRLFRPQLAGESERQLHVHLQEDSTAISRHTGVPGIRLLSRSWTVPAALPLVDSCDPFGVVAAWGQAGTGAASRPSPLARRYCRARSAVPQRLPCSILCGFCWCSTRPSRKQS